MATQTTLTLNQFLALPEREPDGTDYELSNGELIVLAPSGYRHSLIVGNIVRTLGTLLNREKYLIATGDVGFILNPTPGSATVRGADVAVNTRESVGSNPPDGFFPGSPLVAVEVVSPSNTAADLERKVTQYMTAGTVEVWLVYPDSRKLYVYSSERRNPEIFHENDRFPSVLGHEFDVKTFFEI